MKKLINFPIFLCIVVVLAISLVFIIQKNAEIQKRKMILQSNLPIISLCEPFIKNKFPEADSIKIENENVEVSLSEKILTGTVTTKNEMGKRWKTFSCKLKYSPEKNDYIIDDSDFIHFQ